MGYIIWCYFVMTMQGLKSLIICHIFVSIGWLFPFIRISSCFVSEKIELLGWGGGGGVAPVCR